MHSTLKASSFTLVTIQKLHFHVSDTVLVIFCCKATYPFKVRTMLTIIKYMSIVIVFAYNVSSIIPLCAKRNCVMMGIRIRYFK